MPEERIAAPREVSLPYICAPIYESMSTPSVKSEKGEMGGSAYHRGV